LKPDVFRELQAVDWGNVGKRLLAYAKWRAGLYKWRTGNTWELARGYTPEDVVQEVIRKTINGERQWDPTLGPIEPWLRDQVNSMTDALAKSGANRRELFLENGDDHNRDDDSRPSSENLGTRGEIALPSAENELLKAEREREINESIDLIFEAVADDRGVEEIIIAILDGCEPKPRFLAERLGITVAEVNNRVKRLRRKALRTRKALQ